MKTKATDTRPKPPRRLTMALLGVGGLLGLAALLLLVYLELHTLPFDTVARYQGVHLEGGGGLTVYHDTKPALFVVAKSDDLDDSVVSLLGDHTVLVNLLRTLDYQQYFAILVLHGATGPGRAIAVQRLFRFDNRVIVWASTTSLPEPTIVPAVASPYHLIKVSKTSTWGEQIEFVLVKDFRPSAEATHFIP